VIRVVTGPGCLEQLAAECERLGVRRVLVVTSDSSRATAARSRTILGEAWGGEFSDVVAHVPAAHANAVVATAQEIRADSVVTFGGGSATGLGKIVALALGLPLVAVPITYAGCEMTALYGVTTDRGFETGTNDRTRPRAVFHDAELSLTLPPAATADSGFDAIGGCLDVLWQPAAPAAGVALARDGLRRLWATLPSLVNDPFDVTLRQAALEGARAGGGALDVSGPGLYRRLSWALAALRPVGPARLSGWLLPRLAAFHADGWDAAALHCVAGDARPSDLLAELGERLGLIVDPAALGYGFDDLGRATARVAADPPPSPVPLSEQALREVLTAAP
jgi:maleylacetate reductase